MLKTGKVANKWQKIPRVAQKDGRSCQKMANVTNSCQKMAKVANRCEKFLKGAKRWQKLPQKMPKVVKSSKKLPKHLTFDDICHKITFAILRPLTLHDI